MPLPIHLQNRSEIQTIIDCLKTHPIEKAYIFGSMARNEETRSSDIDLLVTVDSNMSLFDFIKIQQKLESELKKTIDLISDEGLSAYIAPYINQDKVLIYERENS